MQISRYGLDTRLLEGFERAAKYDVMLFGDSIFMCWSEADDDVVGARDALLQLGHVLGMTGRRRSTVRCLVAAALRCLGGWDVTSGQPYYQFVKGKMTHEGGDGVLRTHPSKRMQEWLTRTRRHRNRDVLHDLFPDKRLYNFAVGGDNVSDMRKRIQWLREHVYDNQRQAPAHLQPSCILVCIGANDFLTRGSEAKNLAELASLIARALHELHELYPKAALFLLSQTPFAGDGERVDHGNTRDGLNPLLVEAFRDGRFPSCAHYVDVYDIFLHDADYVPRHIKPDGLHFSHEGYCLLARALRRALHSAGFA